ncbi:MAG: zinc-ribbon domain-containing protein [Devosia sp.]
MIITCPHCETKYQVTYEAIGSAGRKVQCAHCQQAWQQRPLDPEPEPPTSEQKEAFEAIAEDGLDEAMADEERKVAAEIAKRLAQEQAADGVQRKAADAGKTEAAMLRKRQKDFTRRQSAMVADLPLARLRRSMRIASVLLVGGLAATGYFARVQVVERYPQMAGVYEAIGLGVNVVGLDFSDVTTLRTLRDGKEVLVVSAQIVGIKREPVVVPSVVVTLLNAEGEGIYEWSVTPSVRDLMTGERSTFDTQLTMPPGEATRVRLSFAGGQDVRKAADSAATTAETTPEHN